MNLSHPFKGLALLALVLGLSLLVSPAALAEGEEPAVTTPTASSQKTKPVDPAKVKAQKAENAKLAKERITNLNNLIKRMNDQSGKSYSINSLTADGANFSKASSEARKAKLISAKDRAALIKEMEAAKKQLADLQQQSAASNDPQELKTLKNKIRKDFRIYSYLSGKIKALTEAEAASHMLQLTEAWANQVKAGAEKSDDGDVRAMVPKINQTIASLNSTQREVDQSSAYLLNSDVDNYEKSKDKFKKQVADITAANNKANQAYKQLKPIQKAVADSQRIERSGRPYGTVKTGYTYRSKASTYGNDPKTGYVDRGDNNRPALAGASNNRPGIAVYNRKTLGGWWEVTAPDGKTAIVQQTDIGPAPWTNRSLDVNAVAARSAFGLKSGNAFPTDQGTWTMTYLGKKQPANAATSDTGR